MRWAATRAHLKPHPSAELTTMELFREDRATPQAPILGRQDVLGHSFKENLRHHPLVFVIEEMAVKEGHASDYGVGEVYKSSETGLTDFREFERTETVAATIALAGTTVRVRMQCVILATSKPSLIPPCARWNPGHRRSSLVQSLLCWDQDPFRKWFPTRRR